MSGMSGKPRLPRQQRNDREYTRKRDALKRQTRRTGAPCHLCHRPFDWSLHWKHPMAFTADHVDPVATGGSMTGDLKPAHRSCNSRRQTTPLEQLQVMAAKPKHSQRW